MRSAPQVEPDDLNLLRSWREPVSRSRIAYDVAGSLLAHVLIFAFVIFAPDSPLFQRAPEILADFRKPVPLYFPSSSELTQKAPNQGQVLKRLDLRSAVQAQSAQAPKIRQFIPPPGPAGQGPNTQTIQASQLDAPQLQTGPLDTPLPSFGAATAGLSAGQSIGAPKPVLPAPPKAAAPKADPLREALRAGGGGVTVGDLADDSPHVPGITPSPCNDCSALQLLSDPKNVDFKPYLLQVLALVKRHWMSVIPASARSGRRGMVVLKFAIDRHGAVPQLEFTVPTGTDFDRAAIAGISASVPFPPFPPGFNGDQIRLQMAFAYNQVVQ